MSRDPGDIPERGRGLPGRMDVLEALSASTDLPEEALELAVRAPDRLAPAVLAALGRAAAGDDLPERDANLLFWGVHVVAGARDTRVFRPLLRLLRRPVDDVGAALGDAVGTTLPRVVASTFDGDAAGLFEALADRDADEAVRWDLFGALAFLTFSGAVERGDTLAFLRRFEAERLARAGGEAWYGWEFCVATLGLDELVPAVAEARRTGRIVGEPDDEEAFAAILADAKASPDDPTRFHDHGLGLVEDVVGELADALADGEDEEPPEPVRNPMREVGRNDPCPCGSGKKFKKCCLDAA